ncbi:hypothetical protein P154DRAFT_467460 [Amniculicola lignicola CBS 123094]|uniref:Adipose-regulatory protein-domain-containing protein n=1 Tax=Amniculicola lignicola CBS 123094 TaxID=1392246 RepID=A0A6A5WDC8_9PLEO|nr:hypothetical protein P154DRAFT_467460 [Amniculicola lignicola CBS 123094]
MDDADEDSKESRTFLTHVKDTLLAPVYFLLSPTLLRTYLRTLLLLLASSILFGLAVIAYTSFYLSYIPVRGISVPVYLQYDHSADTLGHNVQLENGAQVQLRERQKVRWTYGVAGLKGLVSRQKYDVLVEMRVPRSERNLGVGNWMVGVEIRGLAGGSTAVGVKNSLGWDEEWDGDDSSYSAQAQKEKEAGMDSGKEKPVVLARSRRPAILTYRSWMTETVYRGLRLPVYVLGWGDESEKVVTRMMEDVEFEKGVRNTPSSLRLELRSRRPLEVYDVVVKVVARLEGLRWIMYNHRIASFIFFSTMFWAVEMALLIMTWGMFTLLFGGKAEREGTEGHGRVKIKQEPGAITPKTEGDISEAETPLSDTERTFPTLSSQQPLRYSSPTEGKSKSKGERDTPRLEDIPARTDAEADAEDEDEDADFILDEPVQNTAANVLTDSGIGTSMESGRDGDRGLVRRRSQKDKADR